MEESVFDTIKVLEEGGIYIGEFYTEDTLKTNLTSISKQLGEQLNCNWCTLECIDTSDSFYFNFSEPFFYLYIQSNVSSILEEIIFSDESFIKRLEQLKKRLIASQEIILNSKIDSEFKKYFLKYAPLISQKLSGISENIYNADQFTLKQSQSKPNQSKKGFRRLTEKQIIVIDALLSNPDNKLVWVYRFLKDEKKFIDITEKEFRRFLNEERNYNLKVDGRFTPRSGISIPLHLEEEYTKILSEK